MRSEASINHFIEKYIDWDVIPHYFVLSDCDFFILELGSGKNIEDTIVTYIQVAHRTHIGSVIWWLG